MLKPELLEKLKSYDTPTICNALEVVEVLKVLREGFPEQDEFMGG